MTKLWLLGRRGWVSASLLLIGVAAAAAGVQYLTSQKAPALNASGGNGIAAASFSGGSTAERPETYIVLYREQPLASYAGEVAGIPAPERLQAKARAANGQQGKARIDVKGANARSYVRYLQGRQSAHEARISASLGRTVKFERRMQHAINGAVVEMSDAEAQRVAALSEVSLVEQYREYQLDTDTGPALIGAPALWEAAPTQFRGEGIVVGVIDSGINFGSPSFAATDETGYTHSNPLGAGVYLGTCAAGGVDAGRCNDKLIGGYDFVCLTPGNVCGQVGTREEPGFGDTNSHGSHTASTAVGNLRAVVYNGAQVTISGVAPRANIIAYDTCYTNTSTGQGLCPNVSTVAAINQAIADGVVDVINYSISGGTSPWSEATSLAFLNATDAGIYVATSAGNSGPAANTLGHLEPWTATTAAAQHGRAGFTFLGQLTGPGVVPAALQAIELIGGANGVEPTVTLPASTPLRVSGGFGGANDGCAAYPAGAFSGAIVVIRRGDCGFNVKANNAAAAGAVAVWIANNVAGVVSPSVPGTTIPVYGLQQADAAAVIAFANSVGGLATATVNVPAIGLPNLQDVLAGFSSRGPAGGFNLLKPDITAPGVDVLAVYAGTTIAGSEAALGLMSGTSMASPHHAGAAALLKQARPTWTVHEIKSALMMTAYEGVLKEDGVTQANAFAMGAGRVQVDKAFNAGLVLNETKAKFLAADPANGGDVTTLNLPSMAQSSCVSSCSFTRVFRSTLSARQSWTLKLQGLSGVVSPSLVSLNPGETKSVKITVTTGSLPANGSWNFGKLVISPQGGNTSQPVLHLPIGVAVQPPVISVTPATANISVPAGSVGTVSLQVANLGGSNLNWLLDKAGVGSSPVYQAPRGGVNSGFRSSRYTDPATVGLNAQFNADDFIVTGPTTISKISAEGFVLSGMLPTTAFSKLRWSIFPDADGVPAGDPLRSPGAAIWHFETTPTSPGVSLSGGNISLDLALAGHAPVLPAGHYWLVVSTEGSFANRWAWFGSANGSGSFMGLNVGTNNSGAWVTNNAFSGLAYEIQGTVNCNVTWIGAASRASGRVAGSASQSTQVQVNAAGLAAGTYQGPICISSNDPITPKLAVPVTLTVTP